jgi:hypothetical protein
MLCGHPSPTDFGGVNSPLPRTTIKAFPSFSWISSQLPFFQRGKSGIFRRILKMLSSLGKGRTGGISGKASAKP